MSHPLIGKWRITAMDDFDWQGSDEMTEVGGDGWVELGDDGSIAGEICYTDSDDWSFIATGWSAFLD
jgi:hypothetical protein